MTTIVHAAERTASADPAYAAFERGDLQAAARGFAAQLRVRASADAHYMLGLACKYLREWPLSLQHNLRALALRKEFDEAAAWNAGIAATALGDWAEARRQWQACGLAVPPGAGPIDDDFGLTCIRLNPWDESETVFARRIDPARARLLNVPLPESGYRYGDLVLHDGAPTGTRRAGSAEVPVFNALARLLPSEFRTYTAFVRCEGRSDIEALLAACGPGLGSIEDWTRSISHYCLRCSAGLPHDEDDPDCDADAPTQWDPLRTVGVAAQSRHSVDRMLRQWKAQAAGRALAGVESPSVPTPEPPQGVVWWRLPREGGADVANASRSSE